MLLAINSGNTNTVFALFDGEQLKGVWKAAANHKRTGDEYAVWLTQLMALEGYWREDVSAVIVSHVVPAVTFNLKSLSRRYFKAEPRFVGEDGVELGIKVLLDR